MYRDGTIHAALIEKKGTESMTEEIRGVALTDVPTNSQRVFVRYLMAI